jgi:hypothetical protein
MAYPSIMVALVINACIRVIFIKNSRALGIGLGLFFIILFVFVCLIGQKLGAGPDLSGRHDGPMV